MHEYYEQIVVRHVHDRGSSRQWIERRRLSVGEHAIESERSVQPGQLEKQ